jgi:triosephosphate isomerase
MLLEIPVSHVIIGHSERREYFAETDTTVNLRLKAALAAGLIPIVCVGERLEQRENGETEAVVTTQVRDGLAGLSVQDMARVVIAYEPVWAIGTGRTATPEQAQDVHALIRCLLTEGFGAEVADSVRILYGGSVKPANSLELLGQPDIDGALVGGASLQVADFAAIVRSAATAADA